MLHFGQPTVKTQCDVYSTNRRLDTVYTRLRLGHCGLGFHHPRNQSGLCPHCADPEDPDHVFFDCESHIVHRRDLKATVFKLGYTQIDLRIILFPPLRKTLKPYKLPSLSSCEKHNIHVLIRSNNISPF